MPIFGEFCGFDRPELILALETQPQLNFKTYPGLGHDPAELQEKTGIITVTFEYGDLSYRQSQLFTSLRVMGQIVGREERAEAVVRFFEETLKISKNVQKGIPDTSVRSRIQRRVRPAVTPGSPLFQQAFKKDKAPIPI